MAVLPIGEPPTKTPMSSGAAPNEFVWNAFFLALQLFANRILKFLYGGTVGQVLTSNGPGVDPTYQTITPAGPVVQTTTLTGTQNDFVLTARCSLLRCNNATALTITGFAAGSDGQRVDVVSIGAGQVDFTHQSAGSVAANRLLNIATTISTSLAAGAGTATYIYDATTARWRLDEHTQGALITIAYAAGNFTAEGGGNTWTVDAGDQATHAYLLQGRVVTQIGILTSTSVGGPPSFIGVATPFAVPITVESWGLCYLYDNSGTTFSVTTCQANPSIGTRVRIFKFDQSVLQVSTNNTHIRFFVEYGIG